MAPIEISMKKYMTDNPTLKYLFFGGKGGVGKTVMAGTASIWAAQQGKRTLLASTNPVHSLSNMLNQNVFGKQTPVEGVHNLWAYEIDTKETIEKSKREIREKIEWFLKFADIKTKADEFVESATMNPSFEESAMFENMIDLMFNNEYDAYVFDTAPTANARRLLGMSSVYSMWVNKMVTSREEATSLKDLLSYSKKKKEKDPLMDYLLNLRTRMAHPSFSLLISYHCLSLGSSASLRPSPSRAVRLPKPRPSFRIRGGRSSRRKPMWQRKTSITKAHASEPLSATAGSTSEGWSMSRRSLSTHGPCRMWSMRKETFTPVLRTARR